jgi:hypothetical protein
VDTGEHVTEGRGADLTASEVAELPEVRTWPEGAIPRDNVVAGTGDGVGFDNLSPNATLDRYFTGPHTFEQVLNWYEAHLTGLGWPTGEVVSAEGSTRWHRWSWGRERVDLIDRMIAEGDPLGRVPREARGQSLASELPEGWSAWSVTYSRQPS